MPPTGAGQAGGPAPRRSEATAVVATTELSVRVRLGETEEERRSLRRTDAGLVVVPRGGVQRRGLNVDRPQPVPETIRGVDAVDEVRANLRERLRRRRHVV